MKSDHPKNTIVQDKQSLETLIESYLTRQRWNKENYPNIHINNNTQ